MSSINKDEMETKIKQLRSSSPLTIEIVKNMFSTIDTLVYSSKTAFGVNKRKMDKKETDEYLIILYQTSKQLVAVLPYWIFSDQIKRSSVGWGTTNHQNDYSVYFRDDGIYWGGEVLDEKNEYRFSYELSPITIAPEKLNEKISIPKNVDNSEIFDVFSNTTIDIQLIKDSLLYRKQIILMGPPGTSKTYLAEKLALALTGGQQDHIHLVQFHPAYSYEDFIESRILEVENGASKFVVVPKIFRKVCEQAKKLASKEKVVLIIDEINRGKVEKILGELIYGLEHRDIPLKTLYSDDLLEIPANLLIIGTMNTADLSITNLDAALRRRFYLIEVMPDPGALRNYLELCLKNNHPEFQQRLITFFTDLIRKMKENPLMSEFRAIGHAYFMIPMREDVSLYRLWNHIQMTWNFSIRPTLFEYVNFNPSQIEPFEALYREFFEEFDDSIQSQHEHSDEDDSESDAESEEEDIIMDVTQYPDPSTFDEKVMQEFSTGNLQKIFWFQLLTKVKQAPGEVFRNINPVVSNWIAMTLGPQIELDFIMNRGNAAVQLRLWHKSPEVNQKRIALIQEYLKPLEINEGWTWGGKVGKRTKFFEKRFDEYHLRDFRNWGTIQDQLIESMMKLYNAIKDHINGLKAIS